MSTVRRETKKSRTRRVVLEVLIEHEATGGLPTSIRFVFYELEQVGNARKPDPSDKRPNKRRSHGWPPGEQDIIDAVRDLREDGEIPWSWIVDETRTLTQWDYAPTVLDYVLSLLDAARINPWGTEPPPLVLCESRATAGVLRAHVGDYVCPITGTAGQANGYLRTEVAPLLVDNDRRVLYLGDLDFSGQHIETNTRRVLERAFGQDLDGRWRRLGMTEAQATAQGITPILKTDGRTRKLHEAIEVEALGQAGVVALVRDVLDALLPEPLDRVLEREQAQRSACADVLATWKRGA